MPAGIHPCAKHKFSTDSTKTPEEQEDEWYQHLRDFEHEYTFSQKCQNCKKKRSGKMTGKVPQPHLSEDGKMIYPKAMIVFCDNNNKCKNDWLDKIGVNA